MNWKMLAQKGARSIKGSITKQKGLSSFGCQSWRKTIQNSKLSGHGDINSTSIKTLLVTEISASTSMVRL